MNALETLRNEHGLIRQFLDNLDMAEKKLETGEKLPREFFDKALDFIRSFVDKTHHIKEEHVMFVRLAQRKEGTIDGQIESLRHEHERGRNLISEISDALPGYLEGNSISTSKLIESVAAYISLLRHHIHSEDHVFYPMVEKTLTGSELGALDDEFERQREKAGQQNFENYHKIVVDMGSTLVHRGLSS